MITQASRAFWDFHLANSCVGVDYVSKERGGCGLPAIKVFTKLYRYGGCSLSTVKVFTQLCRYGPLGIVVKQETLLVKT